MKVLAIIPSRYPSTRFPGKPLALLAGKPIVQWVWERVSAISAVSRTVVATDDRRIADAVEAFGGCAMMTADTHRSGTDRCGEVLQTLERQGEQYDVVVNVQGDEPFVAAAQVERLVAAFVDPAVLIATLKTPIRSEAELWSENNVKVVCNRHGNALYFSRLPLPFRRGVAKGQWLEQGPYFKHVGVYAFRAEVLPHLCAMPVGGLEQAESLEQLRWLEAGYPIAVAETDRANIGIDTPDDLAEAEAWVKQHEM